MATPSNAGVAFSQSRRWPAARQPSDMTRKEARSTMVVKNVRKKTCAGNQRMQASSRNRSNTLTTNNWTRAWDSERATGDVSLMGNSWVATGGGDLEGI